MQDGNRCRFSSCYGPVSTLIRLTALRSFLCLAAPLPAGAQEPGPDLSPQVLVEIDDQLHTRTYSAASDSCRISWILYESEPNRGVVRHYSQCRDAWTAQIPLISAVAGRIFQDPLNRNGLHTLTWGRLTPDGAIDVRMAIRLAVAAVRSEGWDRKSGESRTVHINRFVRDLANQASIYAELTEIISRIGLSVSVSSVEKVLVSRAAQLPFFEELARHGVRATDKVPWDCQIWFQISEKK